MSNGEQRESVVQAQLPAPLDDAGTAEIGPELRRVAAEPAYDRIVLDAGGVSIISSAGLGLLAAVGLIARRRGAQVDVLNCEPHLLTLLRMAGLAVSTGHSAAERECDDRDWTPWWTGAAANA